MKLTKISDLSQRKKIRDVENWTMYAIWIEGFFLAIFPSIATFALMCGIFLWFLRLQLDKNFKLRPLPYDLPIVLFMMLGTASVIFSPVRNLELFYNLLILVGTYI